VVLETAGTGLDVASTVRLDQVRTVDRQRLLKRLGTLDDATMEKVDGAQNQSWTGEVIAIASRGTEVLPSRQ
jgi:mRNA-degrading endonuclease toxin of MazEF toxin-antitoxin module